MSVYSTSACAYNEGNISQFALRHRRRTAHVQRIGNLGSCHQPGCSPPLSLPGDAQRCIEPFGMMVPCWRRVGRSIPLYTAISYEELPNRPGLPLRAHSLALGLNELLVGGIGHEASDLFLHETVLPYSVLKNELGVTGLG